MDDSVFDQGVNAILSMIILWLLKLGGINREL